MVLCKKSKRYERLALISQSSIRMNFPFFLCSHFNRKDDYCAINCCIILQAHPEARLPTVSLALFLQPGGDKYCIFLLRLTTFLLGSTLEGMRSKQK